MSHSIIARDFRGSTLYLTRFGAEANHGFDWSTDVTRAYRFESAQVASTWLAKCIGGRFYMIGVRANGTISGIRERIKQEPLVQRTPRVATHSELPHGDDCICIRCHDSAQGLNRGARS